MPRSGCASTINMGTPTSAPAFTMSCAVHSVFWSAKYFAIASIKTSLTHSDGWKWNDPICTQRRAPRYFLPKTATATREPIEIRYSSGTRSSSAW